MRGLVPQTVSEYANSTGCAISMNAAARILWKRCALNGAICGCSINNRTKKIDKVGIRQEIVAVLIAIMLQIREPGLWKYGSVRPGCADIAA